MAPKSILLNLLGLSMVGGIVIFRHYYINSNKEIVEEREIKRADTKKSSYKTIKEVLASKNPLSTKDDRNNDLWKQLINKLSSSSISKDKKIKIEGILPSSSENDNFNIAILKHSCEILLNNSENFENDKESAENWCTQESPFLKTPNSEVQT